MDVLDLACNHLVKNCHDLVDILMLIWSVDRCTEECYILNYIGGAEE